ncbi:hypothetical protein D3C72_2388780 [compost metagenome]
MCRAAPGNGSNDRAAQAALVVSAPQRLRWRAMRWKAAASSGSIRSTVQLARSVFSTLREPAHSWLLSPWVSNASRREVTALLQEALNTTR